MTSRRPVQEEDLQAYIDSVADEAQVRKVEAYLSDHPTVAEQVSTSILQRELLRQALAPIADEPVPPNLNVARMVTSRTYRRSVPIWRIAAAAILLVSSGLAAGWMARGALDPPRRGVAAVANEAAESFRVYAYDKAHPVEIEGDRPAVLVSWVSSRLGRPVSAPDLSSAGFRLMGGRVVPTPYGPAAFFLYQNRDARKLAVFERPMRDRTRTTGLSDHKSADLDELAWANEGLGYGLVSSSTPAGLRPIADQIRKQSERTVSS